MIVQIKTINTRHRKTNFQVFFYFALSSKRTKLLFTVNRNSFEPNKSIEIQQKRADIVSCVSLLNLLSLSKNDVSLRPYSLTYSARMDVHIEAEFVKRLFWCVAATR